jgi:outer membrane protein assembly factor BamB
MMRWILLAFALTGLWSCGETDNTEPPAELVDFDATADIDKLWSVSIGEGVAQQYLRMYPLVLKDRIIAAGRDGRVVAVNLAEGDVLWRTDLDVQISGGVGGNEAYCLLTTRDGDLIALDAQGKQRWTSKLSGESLVPPLVANDRAIVRTIDGRMTAFELSTGKQAWTYSRDVPALTLRGNSVPVLGRDVVYTGLDNGRLIALDITDGHIVFDVAVATPAGRSEIERLIDIDGDVVLDQNTLYVASYQGRVVAVDARRGQLTWTRKLSTSTGLDASSSTLFASDEHDHVVALDRNNGATLWKQEKLQARQLTRPAVMLNTIVVADAEGYLHWLSQFDGHFIARKHVDSDGILVPPVVLNDKVLVMTRDGDLVAYQFIEKKD